MRNKGPEREVGSLTLISNGFNKFHLSVLAAELAKRGLLGRFFTGAYPHPSVKRLLGGVTKQGRLQRLRQRLEDIPDHLIDAFWLSESIYVLRTGPQRFTWSRPLARLLNAWSFSLYGLQASIRLGQVPPAQIYHYRAGMGGRSLERARAMGMVCLCDHSIAHPTVLEYLVNHDGKMPQGSLPELRDPMERLILQDIERADHVLVNSDFVKETMVAAGMQSDRITVVYLGVDDQFLSTSSLESNVGSKARLMFAGGYSRRKGVPFLERALLAINDLDWELVVAAGVRAGSSALLSDPRVMPLGFLTRADLAKEMTLSDIFVFPSLAEGSARVIFEALASGCYVITTPNSGSIVEDGVHGALVPPGDASALERAIRDAMSDLERVRSIGRRNAELVRSSYRQSHYADQVLQLYGRLLSQGTLGSI